MAVLLYLDGVMRDPNNKPIVTGLTLFYNLNQGNAVTIASPDSEKTDTWLKNHKINKVDFLIDYKIPAIGDFPEWRQFEYARSKGHIDLVVTPNPELAKKLLEVGCTSLLFLHPSYLKEEFRPDSRKGVRSWSSIVEELQNQQDKFAEDPRI